MQEFDPPEENFDFRTLLRPWVRKGLEKWERSQPDWLAPKPQECLSPLGPLSPQKKSEPEPSHALD